MNVKRSIFILFFLSVSIYVNAQTESTNAEKCGTMERLQIKFKRNPSLKTQFEKKQAAFNQKVISGSLTSGDTNTDDNRANRSALSIPVVFHIVLQNPEIVTNEQIIAQLDTLNKDFFGSNGDSIKIPAYFRLLYGKSGIQFCLAKQTPDGQNTNGIERVITRQTSFSNVSDAVKHATSGGADIWDNNRYLNVWICVLSNGIVGYASFPDDGDPDEEGVVVDHRALPGGSFTQYNAGRTLTHETGHYFNLYHIWGDDDGACSGSDFVDDTPNQSGATVGCLTGVKNDNCTPSGNGIMYQNFMDYSYDNCLALFTTGQVARMESAAIQYHSSLLNSDVCQAPIVRNYDVKLQGITKPLQRLCSNTLIPAIAIQNRGLQTLTSLTFQASIDGGSISAYQWSGSLARLATTTITLPALNTPTGRHTLNISILRPNNNADEDVSNDTASVNFQYYEPVAIVSESFEGIELPPASWDVVNTDLSIGWKRVTAIAKTGIASAMLDNFSVALNGQKDDLRLPNISIPNVDSAFLSFQVAAAVFTPTNTVNNTWDTLEVLISTDCGESYTSLYKKYGSSLITRTQPAQAAFVPNSNEWRKDSINLAAYRGAGNIVIAFRNTSGNENNVYLDDINLRTVTINPNLKEKGFLVSPNPARNIIAVQFYPQPTNLQAIQLYNIAGQKLAEAVTNGQPNNYYSFDVSCYQPGMYIVRAVFADRVVTRKVVKR